MRTCETQTLDASMRTEFETLLTERHADHVLMVTLNRPNVANAMNTALGRDLLDVFSDIIADPAAARVVVLTGSGERAFCAAPISRSARA